MCLTGAVVCPLAVLRVQLFTGVDNGWPHNVLQYHYARARSNFWKSRTDPRSRVFAELAVKIS